MSKISTSLRPRQPRSLGNALVAGQDVANLLSASKLVFQECDTDHQFGSCMTQRFKLITAMVETSPQEAGLGNKRRELRKGTQSCWECKRRKVRCIFVSTHSTCNHCRRRGTTCIGQEYPDKPNPSRGAQVESRLNRVEDILEQLVANAETAHVQKSAPENRLESHATLGTRGNGARFWQGTDRVRPTHQEEIFREENLVPEPPRPETVVIQHLNRRPLSKYENLAHDLLAVWPNKPEHDIICSLPLGISTQLFSGICKPYTSFTASVPSLPRDLLQSPSTDLHPVLIAHKLLVLGTFLQGVPPSLTRDLCDRGTDICSIMTNVVDTATRLVTTNDELIGSLEGIECIMIEAMYHNYSGNLHRAWISIHRAIAIAQTLALHRGLGSPSLKVLNPETRTAFNPIQICFRLAQMDRYLSIMLGLPHSPVKDDFSTPQALEQCQPNEKLQRIHCVVTGNIIERKEDSFNDLTKVHQDDLLLEKAASEMPSQWWMIPNFMSKNYDDTNLFRDTVRIMDHFSHYHVLMRLHLPYMLSNASEQKYNHSKLTVLNAAREILSRYLAFHTFNPADYYCGGSDFLAFMAITAICFAHISSRSQSQGLGGYSNPGPCLNSLAHSRPSDRGSMERTLELIESMARDDIDSIAYKLTQIIKNILIIEASAADGDMYSASSSEEGKRELEYDARLTNGGKALHIRIPYLGTIHFEHGVISRSASTLPDISPMLSATASGPNQLVHHLPSVSDELSIFHSENQFNEPISEMMPSIVHQNLSRQLPSMQNESTMPDTRDSEPTQPLPSTEFASTDADWYLQGIDLAFFDSILREQT